jgi:hypothetical protein
MSFACTHNHRADLLAVRGHPRVGQFAGAAALAHPGGSWLAGSVCVGDMDVATKADHVGKAKFRQKAKQFLIAEAAIGEDGDAASGRHELGQSRQTGILEIVAVILQFILPDGQPQQWRGAAMAGDQVQRACRLVVVVEIGPVHGDKNVLALADLMRHPTRKTVPYVDAVVAQHPVDLLDRVLGRQAAGLRQRLADHRDCERGGLHDAECGTRQGVDPLGVQIRAKHRAHEPAHLRELRLPPTRACHHAAPTGNPPEHLRNRSESGLAPDPTKNEGIREE